MFLPDESVFLSHTHFSTHSSPCYQPRRTDDLHRTYANSGDIADIFGAYVPGRNTGACAVVETVPARADHRATSPLDSFLDVLPPETQTARTQSARGRVLPICYRFKIVLRAAYTVVLLLVGRWISCFSYRSVYSRIFLLVNTQRERRMSLHVVAHLLSSTVISLFFGCLWPHSGPIVSYLSHTTFALEMFWLFAR